MGKTIKHDVAVIGGGPGGLSAALFLKKAGVSPVIIEKQTFPRYHIGESFTGEVRKVLTRLDLAPSMLKAEYPVKYGVKVFGPGGKNSFWVGVAERDEKSVQKPSWTWQVRRSKFDKMLLDTAIERGVEYLPCEAKEPIIENGIVAGVRIETPGGKSDDVQAKAVIDASGPATFLASKGVTGRKDRGRYDNQVAVFSQVVDAVRDPGEDAGNTLIFYQKKHHWAWFIPIDAKNTSVGVTVPAGYLKAQKLSKEAFLKQELRSLNSELTKRITNLDFTEEVRACSNFSYQVENFTGRNFICVGDAHRFIDPIFSLGVFLAMREGEIAAEAIIDFLAGKLNGEGNPFAEYERYVDEGQDVVQALLDTFWEHPLAFALFAHKRYKEEVIDTFAGRIYGEEGRNNKAVIAMRKLLAKQ